MSQSAMDYSAAETIDQVQAGDATKARYDVIVRARQAIRAGRYDSEQSVDMMLDQCMGRIVADAHRSE